MTSLPLLLALALVVRQDPLEHFLNAPGPEARRAASAEVLAQAPAFDDALARLAQGRIYSADVPRGRLLRLFEEQGTRLDWFITSGAGHNLVLTQEQERNLGRFLFGTRRDPLPERLSWATERTDRYQRRSWLVIDELAQAHPEEPVDESNLLPRWGSRIQLKGPTVPRLPWGRVELEREGNTVRATTERVARFTLLISPTEFDLAEPIEVFVNGRAAFQGTVEPSLEVLLKWAAVDDDRRMLFAAELVLEP